MRYQVRVAEEKDYAPVVSLLKEEANVVLELPRLLTLAVEDLNAGLKERVVKMGATVVADYQYAVDPLFP